VTGAPHRPADPRTELVIIAPLGEPHRRPRIEKVMGIASGMNLALRFWGWRREADERAKIADLKEDRPLMSGGGRRSGLTRLMYPLWTLRVLLALLRERPDRVYCMGFETAVAAYIASKIYRLEYLFDDADRLLLLFRLPGPIRSVIEGVEKRVSRRAVSHMVPGFGRYPYRSPTMTVVRNMPARDQVTRAWALSVVRPEGGLIVYANGWIDPSRGSRFLAKAAARLAVMGSDIRFVIAARTQTDADDLMSLPNVIDLGALPQTEALAWCRAVDLVATFYDPTVPINRWAEPNKWGDCVTMRTPFVVNSEVRTASEFTDVGAAFATPFDDADALIEMLIGLEANPLILKESCEALDRLAPRFLFFDDAVRPLLQRLMATKSAVAR
jgi:hypothetical protein